MVSKRWIPMIVAAALCSSVAMGQERTVTQVTVGEVGLNIESNDARMTRACKVFRPTVDQVKRYFSKAYPVESYVLASERYSPCVATGTVAFTDNNTGGVTMGKFRLHSSGTAILRWDKGSFVTLLYKDNQWSDPYACIYGSDSEGEC